MAGAGTFLVECDCCGVEFNYQDSIFFGGKYLCPSCAERRGLRGSPVREVEIQDNP